MMYDESHARRAMKKKGALAYFMYLCIVELSTVIWSL